MPIDLAYLDLDGAVVELISYEGVSVDPAPQTEHLGYRMITLKVDDKHETVDYLRTKGVDIVWGPRVRETYSRAEICDPNGYHIELRRWFLRADALTKSCDRSFRRRDIVGTTSASESEDKVPPPMPA